MIDLEGRKIIHQDYEDAKGYLIVSNKALLKKSDYELSELFCRQSCGIIKVQSLSLLIDSHTEIDYETGKVRPVRTLLVYAYNRVPVEVRGNTGYFIYGPTLEDVNAKLARFEMEDFFRISNVYDHHYKPQLRDLFDFFEYSAIISISLLTVLSIGYLLVKSYYDVFQKRLMIEKMHGYSFIRRHRRFWPAVLLIFSGYLLGLNYFQEGETLKMSAHFPWLLLIALFLLSLLFIRDRKKRLPS